MFSVHEQIDLTCVGADSLLILERKNITKAGHESGAYEIVSIRIFKTFLWYFVLPMCYEFPPFELFFKKPIT